MVLHSFVIKHVFAVAAACALSAPFLKKNPWDTLDCEESTQWIKFLQIREKRLHFSAAFDGAFEMGQPSRTDLKWSSNASFEGCGP